MKPSPYCTGEPHARDEVIKPVYGFDFGGKEIVAYELGTCRVCGGQRQYPKPSLESIRPDQFTVDAHADNVGRKIAAAHVGFDERRWRR